MSDIGSAFFPTYNGAQNRWDMFWHRTQPKKLFLRKATQFFAGLKP